MREHSPLEQVPFMIIRDFKRQGIRKSNIIVTEKSVPEGYVMDTSSKNVTLKYNSTSNLEITNNLKRGNIRIIKVDSDDDLDIDNI